MCCGATSYGLGSAAEKVGVLHERYAFVMEDAGSTIEIGEHVFRDAGKEHARLNSELKTSVFGWAANRDIRTLRHTGQPPKIHANGRRDPQFVVITQLDPEYAQV